MNNTTSLSSLTHPNLYQSQNLNNTAYQAKTNPTQSQALSSLSSSVSSLRSSLSLLDSSISILDAGIRDFPRLRKVLGATRHFELIPSSTLQSAQQSLAAELEPAIATLLGRCDSHIAKLSRREATLIARSELLEGRLSSDSTQTLRKKRSLDQMIRKGSFGSQGRGNGPEEKMLKLKMLRQKKERLGYAVERLGLQSQQRQRQLRMSVAYGMAMGNLGDEQDEE